MFFKMSVNVWWERIDHCYLFCWFQTRSKRLCGSLGWRWPEKIILWVHNAPAIFSVCIKNVIEFSLNGKHRNNAQISYCIIQGHNQLLATRTACPPPLSPPPQCLENPSCINGHGLCICIQNFFSFAIETVVNHEWIILPCIGRLIIPCGNYSNKMCNIHLICNQHGYSTTWLYNSTFTYTWLMINLGV